MSSAQERLLRLHGLGARRKRSTLDSQPTAGDAESPAIASSPTHSPANVHQEATPLSVAAPASGPIEALAPGRIIENSGGVCYEVTQSYPLSHYRGPTALSTLLERAPALFHRFHPQYNLQNVAQFHNAAFIDTETTGLGGGAGVYCFMVGVGQFERHDEVADRRGEPTHFVVRQLFMRNPAEESALLAALAERLQQAALAVTFNGRTFDLPLLRTRYLQNQRFLPTAHTKPNLLAESAPHLDLLHPARRLWRRRLPSCRLSYLEQAILGLARSEQDVPSHLIPSYYTEYVRSGDAGKMPGIFYHNREDIVSMVSLAEQLCAAFGAAETKRASSANALHGLEWLALGCSHEAAGELAEAERALRRALEMLGEGGTKGWDGSRHSNGWANCLNGSSDGAKQPKSGSFG
ncbi:MAG: ribonuclease H-like domain-containing protein [Caldilineaceae bacterium]